MKSILKLKQAISAGIFVGLALTAWSGAQEAMQHAQLPLMGTRFILHADVLDPVTVAEAAKLGEKINHACSDYAIASELSRLNRWPEGDPFSLSAELFAVLCQALDLARISDGAFDPTVGWHTLHWRKARHSGVLPSEAEISKAKAATGWKNLLLDREKRTVTKKLPRMRIDLGGIAKGYTADRLFDFLNSRGQKHASVAAGGDLRIGTQMGGEKWQVELKTAAVEEGKSQPVVMLENTAISTSGDLYQRIEIGGRSYSHIVDPATGLGLSEKISATVIAPRATLSDALATALCVAPQRAEQIRKEIPGMEYLIVRITPVGEKVEMRSVGFPAIMLPLE